jgi:hypothetical protein
MTSLPGSRRSRKKSTAIPITGLSIFVQDTKPSLEADHPEMTKLEVFNTLNAKWAELDQDAKLQYERRADYSRRTESRKAARPKQSDLNPVPVTAHAIFVKERHRALKEEHPEMTVTERASLIAVEWGRMTKSEKGPFVILAKRETRKFQRATEEEDSRDQGGSDTDD